VKQPSQSFFASATLTYQKHGSMTGGRFSQEAQERGHALIRCDDTSVSNSGPQVRQLTLLLFEARFGM
jgi:hypothetical protein